MRKTLSTTSRLLLTPLFTVVLAGATMVRADSSTAKLPDGVIDNAGRVPDEAKAVTIDEHLGQQLPGDLRFTNENGDEVPLSTYFNHGRPLILQMGYYQCPMLCTQVSRGLIDSVKELGLRAGTDFDMLFVSIDPTETPSLAAMKRHTTLEYYGNISEAQGFHFMVGHQKDISLLTAAAGFGYQEVVGSQQYAHPAVLFVLTPEGKLSRYLYGVKYDPKTLRLSLVEASAGKIGTMMDKFLLICFHYDGVSQHYQLAIYSMRTGGVLTILGLGGTLLWLFRREFHHRHAVLPLKSNRISELSKDRTDSRLN